MNKCLQLYNHNKKKKSKNYSYVRIIGAGLILKMEISRPTTYSSIFYFPHKGTDIQDLTDLSVAKDIMCDA